MNSRGYTLLRPDDVHPIHEEDRSIRARMDRTLQVWELDGDDLIHFVTGPPSVTAWRADGRPFQFSHPCYTVDVDGLPTDWPLVETIDRPLEVKDYNRLA